MGNKSCTQNNNVVKVDFNNCPSFTNYNINDVDYSDLAGSDLPIISITEMSNELPKTNQFGGDLSSFGFNDRELQTMNKYTNDETELQATPNSSFYYPKKLSSLERANHGTESSDVPNKPKKKHDKISLMDTESLDKIDEDNLDDSSSPKKHKMSRYVRTSSQNPYNRTIKSVIGKQDDEPKPVKKNTESSVNVLPTYD